jgi:hypothetical protein
MSKRRRLWGWLQIGNDENGLLNDRVMLVLAPFSPVAAGIWGVLDHFPSWEYGFALMLTCDGAMVVAIVWKLAAWTLAGNER